uniref:Kelch like family member 23 n=1 Tax=Crocodylus porosus TaxID=8502 RepID=A0A7M4FE11_CROPO
MAVAGHEGYAYTFRDASHAAGVLEAFGAFYLDGSFTDVTLRSACGALFPCHRAVLAACSTYFKAMFTADMKEKSKQQISLPGLGRAALEALLDYAYTARVRITAGNVQGLLRAADRLQFAAVKAACERFLLRHLDAANCMGMHAFAQHHHCPELEKEARRLLLAHFEEVWKQEEFVDVSEEKLRFVLSRDNLNVRKAEAAIEAVVRWVAHDVEERIDCIYELLGCIKVDLDETYLRSALSLQKKYRLNDDKIRALIYNALNPKPTEACKRPTAVMYVIGGYYWHPLAEVHVWDPLTNAWIQGTDMPDHTRESYGVTSLGPNIYVTGGYRTENIEALDTVWVYNSETDEWKEGCPMLNARYYHCAVTLGGCVYALGGYRKGAPVQEAECYDPLQQTWQMAHTMERRMECAAVVMNGCIYVTGGYSYSKGTYLQSIEKYDPECNQWEVVGNLPSAMRSHGCVCVPPDLILRGEVCGGAPLGCLPLEGSHRKPFLGTILRGKVCGRALLVPATLRPKSSSQQVPVCGIHFRFRAAYISRAFCYWQRRQ